MLNLYSCDTGIQRIVRHDASDPSVLHYDATWKGPCDGYKFGFGRYFLEGNDEFLDHSEEWLLDLRFFIAAAVFFFTAVTDKRRHIVILVCNCRRILFMTEIGTFSLE